jgi:N-acetylneuraminate synthase/UDP-N-acetylglucosamine 2-epimerase (hydrolysing)
MKAFKIGSIDVGVDCTPLVIPEIGINHGGSLTIAKLMVDEAARNGALLIKHQTHIVDDEMSRHARNIIPGNSKFSIYDVMAECSLSEEDERELMRYAEGQGLVFISTPFSRAAADRLEKFGVSAYKIGSGEMNNYPLIEHIAEFGKPMIVSTGMNTLDAIEKTVNILERKAVPYALLHTTNLYPTKPQHVRLGAMMQMMERFPNVPIGLSDHTLNNNACISAMALGASIVERHFTDCKARRGNDIVCSMDGQELQALIQASDEVFLMRGGEKRYLSEEQVTIDFAFASVVSIAEIKKGETFTRNNVWVKRPGTGELLAEYYNNVLNKTATCDVAIDTQIRKDMVNGLL